MAYPIGNGLLE